MLRTSTSSALHSRIASLEARLAPVSRAEPNPFADQNVVAEVERGAKEHQAYVSQIAERWRVAPEEFAPWANRSALEQQITAATPEQAEEASRALQCLQEEALQAESAFVRRRRELYFEEYARQKRQQELAGRRHARSGDP